MIVPLSARGRTLGALTFVTTSTEGRQAGGESGRRYGAEDLSLAEELGRRAALAIDNARLYREAREALRLRDEAIEQHRRTEEQLTFLVQASGTLTSTLEPAAVLVAVLDLSRQLLPADAQAVWRFQRPAGQWRIEASAGLSESFRQEIIQMLQLTPRLPEMPIVADDVRQSPLLAERRESYRREGICSLLAVPLRVGGEGNGTLVLYHRTPHHFSAAEIQVATALANLTAAALATADLYDEQRRLRAEAQRHREWLAVTLSSIGDGVIATDTDGRVTFLNRVAQGLTGWSPEEAAGQPLDTVFRIVNEQTRQPVESPHRQALREGIVVGLANHSLLLGRDGSETPIDDSAAPIRDEAGSVRGVVLIFRDVTERRRSEEELQRRAERLAEADRRKDQFLAMLGHELRNPLAPIRNAVEVLLQAGDQATVAWARDLIDRQTAHLTRLVDELLDASRIVRGKIRLQRQRIDLAEVVRASAEDHRPELEGAGLTLEAQVPAGPVGVHGDGVRLAQVVGNLLNNSRKFTDRGGRVTVRLREEDGQAVVSVRDTGIGIDSTVLPGLFQVFSQAQTSLERTQGGLGLGLALVKGLVELHGGSVSAASEGPGRGTEICFRVPLDHGAEEPAVTSAEGRQAGPSPQPEVRSCKVLIVEDNHDAADTLRILLELAGHEVAVAYSGPEGVTRARQYRPEAVLCDLGLPGMSGFEVARALRRDPATAAVRLIAVSGYGQEEDQRKAREAGFDHALVKPVELTQLLGLLGGPGG
jgi:PAS domain S-box-containing protein